MTPPCLKRVDFVVVRGGRVEPLARCAGLGYACPMDKLRIWWRVRQARRAMMARGRHLDALAALYGVERDRRWLVFKESDSRLRFRLNEMVRS